MVEKYSSDSLKLSILDGAAIYNGESATQTLQNSTELAILADQLGYTRLWFTEHHNSKHQISTSPDLLSAHMAALTKRIRIGAGGMMLPNHSPLKIAENFSILEALHPGRIDLGMGRASGTNALTSRALTRSQLPMHDDTIERLNEVLAYFTRDFPEDYPYSTIVASPDPSLLPEFFMLGSSDGGMSIAAQYGLGFAFAGQINPEWAIPVLRNYREHFRPTRFSEKPYSILSIIAICAVTDEQAAYLAASAELQWVRWNTGQYQYAPPTVEEAHAHVYTPIEAQVREDGKSRFVIGSPATVKAKLEQLASDAQVDEIMLVNMITDQQARLTSYTLLAKAFNLS